MHCIKQKYLGKGIVVVSIQSPFKLVKCAFRLDPIEKTPLKELRFVNENAPIPHHEHAPATGSRNQATTTGFSDDAILNKIRSDQLAMVRLAYAFMVRLVNVSFLRNPPMHQFSSQMFNGTLATDYIFD